MRSALRFVHHNGTRILRPTVMTSRPYGSYAAALGSGNNTPKPATPNTTTTNKPIPQNQTSSTTTQQFSTTSQPPAQHPYQPQTTHPETSVYILTFLTSQSHHQTLTNLRQKYFPPHLNHLDAHLTLFHALPGSKLTTTIIPTLKSTSQTTPKFSILASTPFLLRNKGIAIGIPKSAGGDTTRSIHHSLQEEWKPFLSEQDGHGGFKPHYTIMNKVDDPSVVDKAFKEVKEEFRAVRGTVEGLTLWRYCDGGKWEFYQDFEFLG